jgi:hypothetical protein
VETGLTNPLFIEFGGTQLTFTTNVKEVHEFVATTFRHMLVPAAIASTGEVSLIRVEGGYELRGEEAVILGGTPVEPILHFVKDEVRLHFMRSRPDLLWLHAGAVERGGFALLLSGPSGQGKSTLATLLNQQGWKYMSDDVVPVRTDNDSAVPFPQAPSRRLHPGREVSSNEVVTLPRERALLKAEQISRAEVPIKAIAFITYDSNGPTAVERLSQGRSAFALLSNLTNFMDHRSSAVDHAVAFARKIPMFSLSYAEPGSGADALLSLWTSF